MQLHDGEKQLGGDDQLHQQVQQGQVAGVQSREQQPFSPPNLARVKIEKGPAVAGQDYNQEYKSPAAVQDYNYQQSYNWLGYSQGLYGNDIKSHLTNPYQNYSNQSWFQSAGQQQLNNYLDVDLSSYHNSFFQQQPSQQRPAEQLSDGLQQLINLQQQQSIKKESSQQQQQQPSLSNQYSAQAALLQQQQQLEAQQQFVFAPGFTSVQPGPEGEDVKPLSKWKTKTNKSRTTCVVCSAKATGWHYNVQACEGCKAFFKRSVTIKKLYKTCTVSFYKLK